VGRDRKKERKKGRQKKHKSDEEIQKYRNFTKAQLNS
jgi:hypothetical protein